VALQFNSWLTTTNYILELSGQQQILTSAAFNNPIQDCSRVQQQCRRFVDFCDRMLNVPRNNRDTVQEFQIQTQTGNPLIQSTFTYYLDNSVSVENVRYLSFFNITPQYQTETGLTTVFAQQLWNKEYREFRQDYPDFTAINIGPPQNWIILPKSLVAGGPGIIQDAIIFFPIPDQQYLINYQAKTNATPLQLDTDPILWDTRYEHILWKWGQALLEDALGEGKSQGAQYYAERALSEYNDWVAGPEEERRAVRTGMKIFGPLRGRRVNFYSDTPTSPG
jgi:hypothetical protein